MSGKTFLDRLESMTSDPVLLMRIKAQRKEIAREDAIRADERAKHGERIAVAIEELPGPDNIGLVTFDAHHVVGYLLAIEEAALAARTTEGDRS